MAARDEAADEIPLLEWVAAGIGLVLVLATVLSMALWAFTGASAPPSISVQVVSVEPLEQGGYVALIRATNMGGRTAAEVRIEGKLEGGSGSIETSEMSFDYLPVRSPREGGLFFRNDPADFRLTVQAKGYRQP